MQTPAPEVVTPWMFLTELVIPALGVLGSIAIAVIALWLAGRDRRTDRLETLLQRRSEIAELLRQWTNDWTVSRGGSGVVALNEARRLAAQIRPPGTALVDWVKQQADDAWFQADPQSNLLSFRPAFREEAVKRIDDWERTARFDVAPIQYDGESPTSDS